MAFYGEYVSVSDRKAKAGREVEKLRKKGQEISPVVIEGRGIARSFWGKRWCEHLESFSDYASRLPRGRSYVRNGSVCHLALEPGVVQALVSGSSMYKVSITVTALKDEAWAEIKARCAGGIDSMLELLQGKLSDQVMRVVIDRETGLFPKPREIKLSCSCPDGARMCKHVAAVLYGVGHRLDSEPELLFRLRQVDPLELLRTPLGLPGGAAPGALPEDRLEEIFGIDLDRGEADEATLFDPFAAENLGSSFAGFDDE